MLSRLSLQAFLSPTLLALGLAVIGGAGPAAAAPLDSRHEKTCTASECHPTPAAQAGMIDHAPFLEEWCDRCHTDHSAATPGLLSAPEPQVCLACHTETETHNGALGHPAGADKCSTCHDPHRSDVRHLLKNDELRLGCVGCHGEELARERQKPHHHQFFDPATECGSCHHAHSNGAGKFLRANVGETCLTCHDMALQANGRKVANIAQQLDHSANVHKPAAEGMCQACHTPHGSLQPSLLKESYPAGNYTSYDRANYGLCWQCHEPSLVEAATTRTATEFRAGDRNLHHLHVAQFGKGRSCHLCHTAHATDRPHLLRETVRFGKWEGPLDFKAQANGGSCATACHREKAYDRRAP